MLLFSVSENDFFLFNPNHIEGWGVHLSPEAQLLNKMHLNATLKYLFTF